MWPAVVLCRCSPDDGRAEWDVSSYTAEEHIRRGGGGGGRNRKTRGRHSTAGEFYRAAPEKEILGTSARGRGISWKWKRNFLPVFPCTITRGRLSAHPINHSVNDRTRLPAAPNRSRCMRFYERTTLVYRPTCLVRLRHPAHRHTSPAVLCVDHTLRTCPLHIGFFVWIFSNDHRQPSPIVGVCFNNTRTLVLRQTYVNKCTTDLQHL